MAELMSHRKRARDDSAEFDPESKRIRDDLLSLLVDDSDIVSDRDSPSQDLDSVIRSFEEEISGSGSTQPGSPKPENIVDLTSDSGESLPELGQLLGFDFDAPAPVGGEGAELLRVSSESSGIGEFWEFQDEFQSYHDSFEFGMSYVDSNNSNSGQGDDNGEYVALDGIFDYSDVNFGSDITWRPETLPAL